MEASRFGIERSMQPRRSGAGKAQGQGAAAARVERRCARLAQQNSAERVRHHQATFLGDQLLRKVARDREIKTISKIAVRRPLTIGAKIGDGVLDLDDHEIAGLAESEDVGTAAVEKREFNEADIAELIEGAADAPSEERGGRGLDIERNGHGRTHMISGKDGSGEINGE